MANEYKGWLLDIYPDNGRGVVVWFVSENGERQMLKQPMHAVFYIGGTQSELNEVKARLPRHGVRFDILKRKHLFHGEIEVLAIRVEQGATQRSLFRQLRQQFPKLDYYNADVALSMHYFVNTGTFPLAFCQIHVDGKQIIRIKNLDDKWSLTPKFPELGEMKIEPNVSPTKAKPASLRVTVKGQTRTLSTNDPARLLRELNQLIREYDPDLILTRYGDGWMFPYLFAVSRQTGIFFNPNRDQSRLPIQIKENQFESYGHLVHRDQQTLLLGRLHLDPQNSMGFKDWGPEGTFETARLSNLPIQNAARRSAGGAFVGMQVTASLQKGILIPINKSQRENFKTANELVAADNGGVIFKPIVGMHANVAEIDFFSMYPNIMTRWNISAETVGIAGEVNQVAPGIGAVINQDEPGIVAEILRPILKKRKLAKEILESGHFEGYDQVYLQTAYEFLKGLGWVSYGYQGFSGNRIGSIEAHEAINAISRNVILQAKEAAEDAGFEVLHIYVDSLFVRVGTKTVEDLNNLAEEIRVRTGLKVDIEGIFNWIVFLPSKQNEKVPVPNSFYGFFGGKLQEMKTRGIMTRRGDTPKYIADVQDEALKILAGELDFAKMRSHIPELVLYFRRHYMRIASHQVPVAEMVTSQTLSRNLEDFKVISSAGRAALQLSEDGRNVSAGQNVDFVRVRHEPFSLSWHKVDEANPPELDTDWYCEQLARAADELLQPFGVPKETLVAWLAAKATYWRPEDFLEGAPVQLPVLDLISKVKRKNRQLLLTHS